MGERTNVTSLFDSWPEKYDSWFTTPIGALVKQYESELLLEMLAPEEGECILDVGCGTGIFTAGVLALGSQVIGLDISQPMLSRAKNNLRQSKFTTVAADMTSLPFPDESFDRVYSMTAVEFLKDAGPAISEFNRVARRGATIFVSTLNSLSPWADRRKQKAQNGHTLFQNMTFRSPDELLNLAPTDAKVRTAIHFLKSDDHTVAVEKERTGMLEQKNTGAFVALAWKKG